MGPVNLIYGSRPGAGLSVGVNRAATIALQLATDVNRSRIIRRQST